jgi:hypothetical protein
MTGNIVFILAIFSTAAPSAERLLSAKQAQTLALNTPDVLSSRHTRGCPKVESLSASKIEFFFQVRNTCPKRGSGLIGNYVVDRRTGEIWADIDKRQPVTSEHLDALRRKMFK